ncbi:hypothetical protein B0H63DRAFT_468045 [Podospora didyma]|uniref:MEI5 protein n=1 Tax=Podospora didyma TaxID=330526 RepID=A0AAE0NRY7_9PEZI|nr:hypothetical protein B0H63DRAFT_468045 [Podospora didyma]
MPPQPNHAEVVEGLFRVVLSNTSFKHLNTIAEENIKLRDEIEKVKSVNDYQDGKLGRLRDELSSAKQQTHDKDVTLEANRKEIKALTEQISVAQKELKLANKQLDAKAHQLQTLESFAIKMVPFSKDDIFSRLGSLFQTARSVAETYFGVDLAAKTLDEAVLWESIRQHKRVRNEIPMPLSNTPSAKHMRMSAFLAILSDELCSKVFRPTYLLEHDEELSELLSELAEKDALRGSYLRSVLLHTESKYQSTMANDRFKNTVQIVFAHFEPLLSSSTQKDSFRSALDKLCKTACDYWQHIQKVNDKVEWTFDLHSPECDWKPFISKASAEPGPKQQPNSNGNSSGSGPSSGKKSQAPSKSLPDLTSDLVDIVVWPGFYAVDSSGTEDGLTPGYALWDSQVLSAKAEEKAQLTSGPHRAARQSSRRSRTMSISASNGSEGNSNSNGGFLSSRVGGGQKGA